MFKIKQFLKKIPYAQKAYRLFRGTHYYSATYWIGKYISDEPTSVVQIGSNDGVSGDPLYKMAKENTSWNILFVEPVAALFTELKRNYGDHARFIFENAAINQDGENQIFYVIDPKAYKVFPELTRDYDQIGSFNKDHISTLSNGKLNNYVKEIIVNCLTLTQLFEKHNIENLDLFIIDAEGYDWKILSQLDLKTYKPLIILLEYCNLDENEKKQCLSFLKEEYDVFALRINYFCIRKGSLSKADILKLEQSNLVNQETVLD